MTRRSNSPQTLSYLFGKDAARRVRVLGMRSARNLKRDSDLRLHLGIPQLIPEWKKLFSPRYLREDLLAGATVACIAIPLSLAIALASGVAPAVGLVTAIVAGIVCALFNGTPLAVSGPAAAMAVLVATAVEKHGMGGLLVVGFLAGALQLLSGIFGLGKLARFVPVPVISGFTAGIGAIILIGQLPRALGLPPPDQSHILDVLTHLGEMIHHTRPVVVLLTLLTLFITMGLPRIFPQLPAPLIAVAFTTGIVALFNWNVPVIGEIPRSLPLPALPAFPTDGWGEMLATAFILFAVLSLETLLSSSAADKLSGDRHDPNQELVGQGIGNVAVSLFGGIPVTGVIARTALNIRSGARTRRAAIFHALFLLLSVFVLAPVMSRIPVATLAGILLSIALVMLHPRDFLNLWQASRTEALIYGITFLTIVFVDLLAGVRAGIIAAAVIVLLRVGHTQVLMQLGGRTGPYRLSLTGSLSFLSSVKIERLRDSLEGFDPTRGVVLDLTRVGAIDTSGAEALLEFVRYVETQGARVVLKGVLKNVRTMLIACDDSKQVAGRLALTETDVHRLLHASPGTQWKSRLIFGVERFREESRSRYEPLFEQLADGQQPHTLFITCSDSRISPNLVTSTEPGELFIVRNAGNVVPASGFEELPLEGATVEYAVGVLGVSDIVVCGHSGCGAVRACLSDQSFKEFPSIQRLVRFLRQQLSSLPQGLSPDEVAKESVKVQIRNLLTYPIVQKRLEEGKLRIYGWFYDVTRGEFYEWDEASNEFINLSGPAIGARPGTRKI